MKGIILKDFYETFCIKKNLFGFLFSFAFVVLIVAFMKNLYTFILIVVVTLPLVGSSPMQYSMEQDDISGFNSILLTYPLSKKKIMLAKYLSCFLFLVGSWIFSFLIMLVYVYVYKTIALYPALEIFIAGMIVSLAVLSICNMGLMILASKKGTILFIAITILFCAGYVFSALNIGVENILLLDKHLLMLIGAVIAIILLFISYYVSLKVYTKRYS